MPTKIPSPRVPKPYYSVVEGRIWLVTTEMMAKPLAHYRKAILIGGETNKHWPLGDVCSWNDGALRKAGTIKFVRRK